MFRTFLTMLPKWVPALVRLLLAKANCHRAALSGVCSMETTFCHLHVQDLLLDLLLMYQLSGITVPFFSLTMFLAISYSFWHVLFHVHSHLDAISFLNGSHTSIVAAENFSQSFLIPNKDWNTFLLVCTVSWDLVVLLL